MWASEMSKYDDKRFAPPPSERGGVWSLAAMSVAALCCSVLGARLLSEIVERKDDTPVAANHVDQSLRQLAAAAPRAQPRQTVTIVHSVDGTPTATIPRQFGTTPSPCGEAPK